MRKRIHFAAVTEGYSSSKQKLLFCA